MTIEPVLDHAVVNVRDGLDDAAVRYRRLGFHLTERGHHTLGSSNHLAVFGENYLELLGFEPGRQTQRADLWKHPPGLTGLVFKTDDPLALHRSLDALKIPAEEPASFSRPVALPEGTKDASFRVVRLGAELVPNGRAFFCHHATPDLVWRDEWRDHPNGAADIVEFVIAARDPGAAVELYRGIFGEDAVSEVRGGYRLRAGTGNVCFLTPEAAQSRFAGAARTEFEGALRMIGLTLKTRSLEQAREILKRNGIPIVDAEGGRIVVSSDEAAGVALAFTA